MPPYAGLHDGHDGVVVLGPLQSGLKDFVAMSTKPDVRSPLCEQRPLSGFSATQIDH